MQHCITSLRKKNERRLYEVYVTDALKAIADNTARLVTKDGMGMSKRYADLLMQSEQKLQDDAPVQETRTAKEIIDDIKAKMSKLGG